MCKTKQVDESVHEPSSAPARTIPIHQWTHTGTKVRILKCVDEDGRGYGGFQWPKSGPVAPESWSPEPTCDSGGLFGWPWGLGRDGKQPNYSGVWIVFEADPSDVIDLGGKVKARCGDVIYYGDWWTAAYMVEPGRIAWIEHAARGAASATGESGAASATGERGAASATGESGAASATGESGAASATCWSGAASATGWRGAASATGLSGAASVTGESGAASATGERGAASATGERGAAAVTGEHSTIEIGSRCAGVAVCESVYWRVRAGALLLCRWHTGFRLLTTDGLADGALVHIVLGEIVQD
jgi:hypothetical protein